MKVKERKKEKMKYLNVVFLISKLYIGIETATQDIVYIFSENTKCCKKYADMDIGKLKRKEIEQ